MTFLPALEFVFKHEERLQAALASPSSYSGLVATSPRGCQAAALAFQALSSSFTPTAFASLIAQWSALPFYAVGEASASLLTSSFPLTAHPIGGNGAALARAIVQQRRARVPPSTPPAPLLVLTGQLRGEVMFDVLREGGVAYEEVEVYDTQLRTGLKADVSALVREEVGEEWEERWLVFFSPSGVSGVKAAWAACGADSEQQRADRRAWRLAALGATSAAAIREVSAITTRTHSHYASRSAHRVSSGVAGVWCRPVGCVKLWRPLPRRRGC